MAAGTAYSDLFDSTLGTPVLTRPRTGIGRPQMEVVVEEIATTSLDDANDRVKLIPVPSGADLLMLVLEHEDLDSGGTPTLDADIVLSTEDSAGTVTDTILFNAGTGFQSARTTPLVIILDNVSVPNDEDQIGSIDFLVNTAAATAAAGDVKLVAFWI